MAKVTANQAFAYHERLTDKEIRVLEFTSPDTDTVYGDDLLRFRLFETSMPSAREGILKPTPYLALSYTWGPDKPRNTILINEKPFTVNPNLFQALTCLKSEIKLPIWIDAICINQKDDDEKAVQVQCMKQIYVGAEWTVIWLGEEDSSTASLFSSLDQAGKDAIEAGLLNLDMDDFKNWPEPAATVEKSQIKSDLQHLMLRTARGSKTGTPFPLDNLIDLSLRPWFGRIWVLQEIANAKDYTFMCGNQIIKGDHLTAGFLLCGVWMGNEFRPLLGGSLLWLPYWIFRMWWRNGFHLIQTLWRRATNSRPLTISSRATSTLGTRRRMHRKEDQEKGTKAGTTLMEHLNRAFIQRSDVAAGAGVPEDRIYGLLGIASDAEQLNIQIDYKSGFQQVYTNLARTLAQNGNLEVLLLCRAAYSLDVPYYKATRDDELPSWAPDWTKPMSKPWGGTLEDGLFHASGKASTLDQSNEQFTLTKNQSDEHHLPPRVLTIRTRFVDTLKDVGSTWNPRLKGAFDHNAAGQLLTEIEAFLELPGSRYTPEQSKEAAWRIPIADQEFDALGIPQRATSKSPKSCHDMRAYICNPSINPKVWGAFTYMEAMKDVHDARPFLSESGYVGLCPDTSEPGDEIHIPLGLHVPIVVRQVENGLYTLVGEAYVQGIMDGELFEVYSPSGYLSLI